MGNNSYITCIDGEKKGFRYASDFAIYTERLIDGRLICADYRDNGIPVQTISELSNKHAFDLVINGESIYFGWEMNEFKQEKLASGIIRGILTLKHTVKPVTLKIITDCGGYGMFKRFMEITNTSENEVLGLTSVTPLSGVLWSVCDNIRDNLKDETVAPYSAGYFKDNAHANEGNFVWTDIPGNVEVSVGSTRGKSGYNHPFILLRNNIYGGYFICQLGWSGNWKASAFYEAPGVAPVQPCASLFFSIAPVSPSPARLINPGETIKVPEVHFGLSHSDFDTVIQNLHSHQRKSVLKQVGDGLQPVIYNQWGYMQNDMNERKLMEEIDIASEIGAEVFMIDAGWYCDEGGDWGETTGDWQVGNGFSNDLFPVYKYAREKGMKCGLWMEVESAGNMSKVAKQHPDWFITRYGNSIPRSLDLAKPEVKDYVESTIIRILERYKIDVFRLDYNLDPREGGFNCINGKWENSLWKHVEAIYDIFDKIGIRYPELQMENCSSGGGRSDVGMMGRFTTTWISDWMRMPRTVRILNGMSMVLPPEYISRVFGVFLEGSHKGNADTMMHVAIMCHPTIAGVTPKLAEANPSLLDCVKKYVRIYKDFVRRFIRRARIYHHTPVISGGDGNGWCVLEYVSEDNKNAVAAVFKLVNAEGDAYRIKFRGLNESFNYKVQLEPSERIFEKRGYELLQDGLEIKLDSALTSKLILLTAIS